MTQTISSPGVHGQLSDRRRRPSHEDRQASPLGQEPTELEAMWITEPVIRALGSDIFASLATRIFTAVCLRADANGVATFGSNELLSLVDTPTGRVRVNQAMLRANLSFLIGTGILMRGSNEWVANLNPDNTVLAFPEATAWDDAA